MAIVTPPELHGLLAIAREEGLDMKPVLLRVLTDLYVAAPHHSQDEVIQFREIAGQMIPHVDEPTALVVACKLASYVHTPPALAETLVARGDDAARITLGDAVWLPRSLMLEHAAHSDRLLAAAVAARGDLDGALMRLLLSRNEAVIDVTLAGNTSLQLPHDVKDELLARGREENAVALALLARSDLTGADKAVLFPAADRDTRLQIIEDAVRLAHLSGRTRHQRHAPEDFITALESAAINGSDSAFRAVLALGLGCAVEKLGPVLDDRSGETLAVVLAAVGVDDEFAARIFMFRDPLIGHSTQRVFSLIEMMRRLPWAAAERITAAMLGLEGTPVRASGPRAPAEPLPPVQRPNPAAMAAPVPANQARRVGEA
jgi:hypothetical protein